MLATQTVQFSGVKTQQIWQGNPAAVIFDPAGIKQILRRTDLPCYAVRTADGRIGFTNDGCATIGNFQANGVQALELLAAIPALPAEQLGDPTFRAFHGVRYAYSTGAMANGIASAELVIAAGKAGCLGSFGAAGLVPQVVEENILRIQKELPNGPYAFNLIHSPAEEALERGAVDRFLKYNVQTVEASAFLDLTPHIVRYRAAGLTVGPDGQIVIKNKVIAKVSRREVARKFLSPAHPRLLAQLVSEGHITQQQANLAAQVPMADDVTVEADSGGHTDNRPLVCLLPSIVALKDEIQAEHNYSRPIRVGAAGGIGTPEAALAAFMMGAAYIVTGSINQACVEAGASEHTRKLLAQAEMADVAMAPAADMFEMGVKLQVLKRGTFFPMRAQQLYDLYSEYDSLEAIPADVRQKIEEKVFRRGLDVVWEETKEFFRQRDPHQIERAENNPKRKMALVFRSYLGLSSRWSNKGEKGREQDYQIWCGPSMGAFNDWVRGTYLEPYQNRLVADVAEQMMNGTAYLYRVNNLKLMGVQLPQALTVYRPEKK
jgi:PfaD family protein